MDDLTPSTPSDPQPATGTEATATDSAPPSPAASPGASGSSGTTAPTESPEREALRRLRAGEGAADIRRDLSSRSEGAGEKGRANPTEDSAAEPANPSDKPGNGLTEKELNALRRGKFDLGLLKHMPVANRKAIAANMSASQAEADRQYQAAKRGEDPSASAPAARADADQNDATPTEQDVATGAGADGTGAKTAVPAGQAPADASAFGQPFSFSDADYATLAEIGGDEFAAVTKQATEGLAGHMQAQIQPLLSLVSYAMQRFENQDFQDALGDLKKQPGFDAIPDADHPKLREKAGLLVRAAGDPSSYSLKDAVRDAAASLYSTNLHQTAQAKLLQRRAASLDGSPERGGTLADRGGRPTSEAAFMRSVLSNMRSGMDPRAARLAAEQ